MMYIRLSIMQIYIFYLKYQINNHKKANIYFQL